METNQTILFNIEKHDREIDRLEFFVKHLDGKLPTKPVKFSMSGGFEIQLELMDLELTALRKMFTCRLDAAKARRSKLVKDLYYGTQTTC